jgi:Rap1a immunity proteins
MDRRLFTVAAVTVMLVARTSAADDTTINFFESGNSLLARCQSDNLRDQWSCMAYSAGVMDTLTTLKQICPPVHITGEQARDIIVNYLVTHPESRQESAPSLAELALPMRVRQMPGSRDLAGSWGDLPV